MKKLFTGVLIASFFITNAQIKISNLPAASNPVGTEVLPAVQNGVTKKVTINQIASSAIAISLHSGNGITANGTGVDLGGTLTQPTSILGIEAGNPFIIRNNDGSDIFAIGDLTDSIGIDTASFLLSARNLGILGAGNTLWLTAGERILLEASDTGDVLIKGSSVAIQTDISGEQYHANVNVQKDAIGLRRGAHATDSLKLYYDIAKHGKADHRIGGFTGGADADPFDSIVQQYYLDIAFEGGMAYHAKDDTSQAFTIVDSTGDNAFLVYANGVVKFVPKDSASIYAITPLAGLQMYCSNCTPTNNSSGGCMVTGNGSLWRRNW